MNTKYWVDIEQDGFNKDAYARAIVFANKLAEQDNDVKRIVCYIHTKQNIGYFEPFFDEGDINKLIDGNIHVRGFAVPMTIQTKITYDKSKYNSSNKDVVVAFGMDLKELEVIDDYYCVKYIIAVPWLKDKTMPWIERWNAEEITGTKRDSGGAYVSEIVKVAMKELSSIINMSTGISHPSDNERAKTYIRALHKYESELNAHSVVSYLVAELGWTSSHANDVGKLITTLNEGRYYKGGEKTGLQVYYKRWKEQAKKSV